MSDRGELVIVPRITWERLQKHLFELQHAIKIITRGEREVKNGKTIRASSLRVALKQYGGKKKH